MAFDENEDIDSEANPPDQGAGALPMGGDSELPDDDQVQAIDENAPPTPGNDGEVERAFQATTPTATEGALPTQDTSEPPSRVSSEIPSLIQRILDFAKEKFGEAKGVLPTSDEMGAAEEARSAAARTTGRVPPERMKPVTGPDLSGVKQVFTGPEEESDDFHQGDYANDGPAPAAPLSKIEAGAGAARPDTLAAVKNAVNPNGWMNDVEAAAKSISYAMNKGGMDAGLGILQAYRREYDVAKSFAQVAFEHGNVTSALDAANRAMRNLPGGEWAQFTQGPGNSITATVAVVGQPAETYNLSPQQFHNLLNGKVGVYDAMLDRGVGQTIAGIGRKVEPYTPRVVPGTRAERLKEQEASDAAERAESLENVKGKNRVEEQRAKSEGFLGKEQVRRDTALGVQSMKSEDARAKTEAYSRAAVARVLGQLQKQHENTENAREQARLRAMAKIVQMVGQGGDIDAADAQLRKYGSSIQDLFGGQPTRAPQAPSAPRQAPAQGGAKPAGKWVFGPDGKPVWQPGG